MLAFKSPKMSGSPPPMRGKESVSLESVALPRITPAYAGKSIFPAPEAAAAWDHPRLCGEKYLGQRIKEEETGSPPPMRGKVIHFIFFFLRDRITPAYAGKRNECGFGSSRHGDHPRLCGEKKEAERKLSCD